MFRAAFASLLRSWGFDIVGQASDGARGIEAAGTLQPDLVFMDLVMPGTGGLAATRAIKSRWPSIRIVILTASGAEPDLLEAIRVGADGYLSKDLDEARLADLIDAIKAGRPAIPAELAHRLVQQVAAEQQVAKERSVLTRQEQRVLVELARGLSDREISAVLGIAPSTVSSHVHHLLGKLGLRNRAQAAAWARDHHLEPPA